MPAWAATGLVFLVAIAGTRTEVVPAAVEVSVVILWLAYLFALGTERSADVAYIALAAGGAGAIARNIGAPNGISVVIAVAACLIIYIHHDRVELTRGGQMGVDEIEPPRAPT